MISPYEYHDKNLGVKVSFLTSDRNPSSSSLNLIKYRALSKRMKSDTCCEKQLRKGSWSYDALILFSSLSQEWKDKITTTFGEPKQEIKKSWFAENYITDKNAYDFYVAHRYGEENKKLDSKLIEQYTIDASVLNTVLLIKENRKAYANSLGGVKIDIWDSLSKDVNAFRDVAHKLPTTRDSLRYKASKYKKEGYISLISGKLQNSNAKKVTKREQLALLDELLAKHTNLDNVVICTLYNTIAEKLNWKTITVSTVANRKQKSNLVTYAGRNGKKALKNTLLMQHKRKAPSAPMLYWTLDGWDVELLYQRTFIDDKGYSKTTYHNRLTIVTVLDPFNKYPIGYAIGTHETPDLIKKALQNAFNHTKELFGDYHKPYELQSDRYSLKKLTPLYEACTLNFSPAGAGNSQAKVIEPYFNYLNKKYCRLLDNWSGFNVDSGSKNQPNTEVLNKVRKSFPDQLGCISQIESIIASERSKKSKEYNSKWLELSADYKNIMDLESYLYNFGSTTGNTNKLRGDGIRITIDGAKHYYDSFDLNFRNYAHEDWTLKFDTNDLSNVLAISSDEKLRFVLEEKYIEPMALADRNENDDQEFKKIQNYNRSVTKHIKEERIDNYKELEVLFSDPELKDTLAKHLLVDSQGQHKNIRNTPRTIPEKAKKIVAKKEAKEEAKTAKTFREEQEDYYNSKINIDQYLD